MESDLIEVMVDDEKIRRRPDRPLPQITDETRNSLNERTVHLRGLPKETTYGEVMNWCLFYGTVEWLQMMKKFAKNKDKGFKGCIFVVFADKTSAERILEEPETIFKGKELLKENKNEYFARKREMIERRAQLRLEAKTRPKNQDLKDTKENDRTSFLKLSNVSKELSQRKIEEFFSNCLIRKANLISVAKIFTKNIAFVRFRRNNTAKHVFDRLINAWTNGKQDQKVIPITIDGQEFIVEMLTKEEEREINRKIKETRKYYMNAERLVKRAKKCINKKVNLLKENPVPEELAVLHIDNSSNTLAEAKIRNFFKNFPKIIDIETLDGSFNIRFEQRFAARNVLAVTKIDKSMYSDVIQFPNGKDFGVLLIDGVEYWAHVLTGEDERNFWLASIDRIEAKAIASKVWKQMMRTMSLKIKQYGLEAEITPKLKKFMTKGKSTAPRRKPKFMVRAYTPSSAMLTGKMDIDSQLEYSTESDNE